VDQHAPTDSVKFFLRPFEKLIPNQSVLDLTARTYALQNCMSLIPKDETDLIDQRDSGHNFFSTHL
jgi:hypothetical protein